MKKKQPGNIDKKNKNCYSVILNQIFNTMMNSEDKKNPQVDPQAETIPPRAEVVDPQAETLPPPDERPGEPLESAQPVRNIAKTFQGRIKSASNPPEKEIPDFDHRELFQKTVRFIAQLKAAVPEERKAQVDAMEKYFKKVVIKIALDAKKLKELDINLSAEQRERSATVQALIPQELHTAAKKEWDTQMRLITGLLRQFKQEGINMIAEVGENGMRINESGFQKIMDVLTAMNKEKFKVDGLRHLTNEEQKNYEERRDEMKKAMPEAVSKHREDIVDSKVDEKIHREILDSLEKEPPESPKTMARKYIIAMTVNFNRLRKSLAAQSLIGLNILQEDIADGMAYQPDYYDESNSFIFHSEADLVAYILGVTERSMEGIISSQKIAQLMGEPPTSAEDQKI